MPSPWALASQSLLGCARVAVSVKDKKDSKIFILDLGSRVLYDENSPSSQIKLTQQQTNFLSMLVIAGKLGLTVAHLKQLCLEFDLIVWKTLEWKYQAKQNVDYQNLLRYRIDGLKRDINKKLKPLGLRIGGEKGKEKWFLESDNAENDFVLKLFNTVWGEFFEKKEIQEPPPGLSKQSQVIWHCLWEYSPKFVHAKALAEVLTKEWNKKTQKPISDAIYKLKQQLKNEPWMIKPNYSTSEYALVPRQSS